MSNDRNRINFFSFLAFLALGTLVARVAYLQLWEGEFYTDYAGKQAKGVMESTRGRGYILDVKGEPLALNKKSASLYVFAGEINDRKGFVLKLKKAGLHLSKDVVTRILKNDSFVWLERNIDIDRAEKIQKQVPNVEYLLEEQRLYPERKLAASVIGFTGVDNKGLGGLEYRYEKILQGHKLRLLSLKDNRGKRIVFEDTRKEKAIDTYLYLTIDKYLQGLTEEILREDTAGFMAKRGIAVAMDAYTGDILFAASSGGFDPNEFGKYSKSEWKNYSAGFLFEPGSIFKPVLFSLLMDKKNLNIREMVNCENGRFSLYGHVIRDVHPYKILTARQVLMKSSNIGTVKLSDKVSKNEFYKFMKDAGFGQKTGVSGLGEEEGILREAKHWSGLSKPSISIGQEVMVTPLQMVRFYSAIANGGRLINPKIVSKVENGGDTYRPKFEAKRIFSENTAKALQSLLRDAVTDGTGVNARSSYVEISGKTGTGQRIDSDTGTYSKSNYVASFAGMFPADNPRIAMVVLYSSPKKSIYGGSTAAYTFSKLAEQVSMHLGIKRSYVYESLPAS
ncbi:Peptidoglycan glycosyltransferase [Denitrovibrio acetiphilus DSM 12809]|uniref:Peptidoglycan glycosyltransferase n=1 Tax=Denitrovibrio acetiphilus (strain DSM 12809 / NBRC 114555 / N2460) TaxID=522772 RepID=D4H2U6_DENA2|nr:penicillin-binding protein 2 [Denitrovibrio acetiphilus]ADD68969.1 Peptidoglycan glycosyltransferase [Denitrovibrio acetiphilus DSM 12809]